MKKLLISCMLLSVSVSAVADRHYDHYDRHHGHYERHNDWWIAPAIIGGAAITYELARPRYEEPRYVYPNQYGSIPYGYHYETEYDDNCYCYRRFVVPN